MRGQQRRPALRPPPSPLSAHPSRLTPPPGGAGPPIGWALCHSSGPAPARRPQISSLAFSPDGASLASADASGTLVAWDLASSKRLATASQHKGPVWSMAYSQGDGALLASGGADNTVRIWNAKPTAAGGAAGQPAGGAAAAAPAAQQQQGQGTAGAQQPGGGGAAAGEPYALLATWRTKLTPVFGLRFTTRNLLLGSGALTLPQRAQRG